MSTFLRPELSSPAPSYHHTQATWTDDIQQIAAKGVYVSLLRTEMHPLKQSQRRDCAQYRRRRLAGDPGRFCVRCRPGARHHHKALHLLRLHDKPRLHAERHRLPHSAVLVASVAVQGRYQADDLQLLRRLPGELRVAVAEGPDGRVCHAFHLGPRKQFWELPEFGFVVLVRTNAFFDESS
jgi:hypothetical protein